MREDVNLYSRFFYLSFNNFFFRIHCLISNYGLKIEHKAFFFSLASGFKERIDVLLPIFYNLHSFGKYRILVNSYISNYLL